MSLIHLNFRQKGDKSCFLRYTVSTVKNFHSKKPSQSIFPCEVKSEGKYLLYAYNPTPGVHQAPIFDFKKSFNPGVGWTSGFAVRNDI